jgi:hypothetical protein
MTKSERFKSKFPEFVGVVDFFTSDCEQVNFIDVPNGTVEFTTMFTLSCGCCSDSIQDEASLSHIMDLMSDDEFEDLLSIIK